MLWCQAIRIFIKNLKIRIESNLFELKIGGALIVKKYNYTFGTLSAFGIIFVVLGHVGAETLTIDNWFTYYSFHMPLFIFISGYFFDVSNIKNIYGYISKKIKTLILPFYFWNLIYLLIQTILEYISGGIDSIGNTISLYNLIVWPWVNEQPWGFNVASWFLIALFIVEVLNIVIEWVLDKLRLYNEFLKLFLYLVICIIGILCIQNGVSGGIKIICRSLYCLFFFQLGHWYRTIGEKKDTLNSTYYFLIVFAVQFLFKCKYGSLDVGVYGGVDFNHISVLIVVPIIGIMFWLRVAKILTPLLKEVKWFVFLGKNTMSIMLHHLFAIFIIQMFTCILHCNTSLFSSFDVNAYIRDVYYVYVPYETMRLMYAIASITLVLLCVYINERIKKYIKKMKWR